MTGSFRTLVQRPDLGPELVRSCLPPELARLFADLPLMRVPDSFVYQELVMHQCDSLFRISALSEDDQRFYSLIKLKSVIDNGVPL